MLFHKNALPGDTKQDTKYKFSNLDIELCYINLA